MKLTITHDLARGLWAHLSQHYGTTLLNPYCDDARHDVGLVLDIMGIRNHRRFVRERAITIVDSIYIPFVPGEVTDKWLPVDQVAVAIHEHHHVVQSELRGSMGFVGGYLVRKDVRAALEGEALRTNLELAYWLTGEIADPRPLAASLEAYGCGQDEIASAFNYLCMAIPLVQIGEVQSEVVRIATKWLLDNRRRADG